MPLIKKRSSIFLGLFYLFVFNNCANLLDDLAPSSEDFRGSETASYPGVVGALAGDYALNVASGNNTTLHTETAASAGVVLYFTMWCSVCDSHTTHIINTLKPKYPNIRFFLVDYVSSSMTNTQDYIVYYGLGGSIEVIGDFSHELTRYFGGTMSSTIVIGPDNRVRFNESFQNGSRLDQILSTM